jgi:hypothetical protein
MPLANLLPELLTVAAGVSRALLTKNASRSSSVLNCTDELLVFAASASSSVLVCEGGRRNHTTHQPRLVLHVRSISVRVRRVLANVARIWECTLSASTRLQPEEWELVLPRPSAMSVPGSGMLGRLEWTVSVRGS